MINWVQRILTYFRTRFIRILPAEIKYVLYVRTVRSHYDAIQVADLVAEPVFDKFVPVCDQLEIFWVENRSQTGWSYLDMCSSNLVADLVATRFRPAFDQRASPTRRGLRTRRRLRVFIHGTFLKTFFNLFYFYNFFGKNGIHITIKQQIKMTFTFSFIM